MKVDTRHAVLILRCLSTQSKPPEPGCMALACEALP